MVYCAGGDLINYMKKRGRVEGLEDIKPQNLLLNSASPEELAKGHPLGVTIFKVTDFGFARSLPNATMAETFCGSTLYTAPEILRYEKYDAKADLWSVGVVLYKMCVGKPPFRAQNHVELLKKTEHSKGVKFPDEDPVRTSSHPSTPHTIKAEEPTLVAVDIKDLIRDIEDFPILASNVRNWAQTSRHFPTYVDGLTASFFDSVESRTAPTQLSLSNGPATTRQQRVVLGDTMQLILSPHYSNIRHQQQPIDHPLIPPLPIRTPHKHPALLQPPCLPSDPIAELSHRLVDNDTQNELSTPYCTLSDHTLQAKDIVCGVSSSFKLRLPFVVHLRYKALGFIFAVVIDHLPLHQLGYHRTLIFAASPDGSIYQVNLYRQRAEKHAGQMIEAIGGTGVSLIRVAGEDSNSRKCLITVDQPITVLTISLTSSLLLPPTKDSKAREAHEVAMMFPVQEETSGGIPSTYDYPEAEFQGDYAFFVQPNAIGTSKASSARVAKLEAEVENLREQLGKAKGIDDVMWETVVQKVMVQEKQEAGQNDTVSGEGEDVDDVERPRKEGKKTSK
ncbi:hypothetical protein EV702DRAFT_1246681 [Suillus placidus]|uniref:non-specific serine/threonine protein kinase n=1 Tax=Suillus placidus TaxID=48579 RepID=A0A9P7CY57_9AGAM|nr:hypothetical protein EV702DRAFT_1246681 [Suillus placidus]